MAEQEVDRDFAEWALQFSGCDGGDIGSPDNPAIWVCGVEPGDSFGLKDVAEFRKYFREAEIQGPHDICYKQKDYPNIADLYKKLPDEKYPRYRCNAFKLLAAINGEKVEKYTDFVDDKKPFYEGGKGYFQMNLFPFPFKKFSTWDTLISKVTGFPDKKAYRAWLLKNRLPVMREWARKYRPKLIICTGLGNPYPKRFMAAFGEETMQMKTENMAGTRILHGRNKEGTLIVVMYHISFLGAADLQVFGKRIRQLLVA